MEKQNKLAGMYAAYMQHVMMLLHALTMFLLCMFCHRPRPDEAWAKYAHQVVDVCICSSDSTETFLDSEELKDRNVKLSQFLAIFNGNWRDWTNGGFKHYCKMGCFCGGSSRQEVAVMAKLLFCQIVLGGKPVVPALNRWQKCRTTARWFFLAYAIHGIYLHGSISLYNLRGTKKSSLSKAYADLEADLAALVQASSAGPQEGGSAADAFTLPDLPVCKILRVRARKSADWVTAESSPVNLAISLVATTPASHFANWVFAQQRDA